MLEVAKIIDGNVSTLNVGYTVDSNIQPREEGLRLFAKQHRHFRQSFGESWSYFSPNIFGHPEPFSNGGVILATKIEGEHGGEFHTISGHPDIVATADIQTEYVGTSTVYGTINKLESKLYVWQNKIQHHLVFDFPTHVGNNEEIHKIIFTEYPIRSGNVFDSNLKVHPETMQNIGSLAYYPKANCSPLPSSASWDLIWVQLYYNDQGEGIFSTGNTGFSAIYYHNEDKVRKVTVTQLPTLAMTRTEFYYFHVNGQWYAVGNGYTSAKSSAGLQIYELEFTENSAGGIELKFKNAQFYKVLSNLSFTDFVVNGVFRKKDSVCFFLTNKTTVTKKAIVEVSTNLEHLKTFEFTYAKGTNFSNSYQFYYDDVLKGFYCHKLNTSGTREGFFVDESFTKVQPDKFISNIYTKWYKDQLVNKLYAIKSTGGSFQQVTGMRLEGVHIYMGEFEIGTNQLVFHLENPIVKTADETMKLTFDITLEQ